MKKILILTIMLFTALASTAFADSIADINIDRDDNGAVVISGSINTSKTNQQLVLTVTNQGSLITAEQITVKEPVKNGKVNFKFDPLLFPYEVESGYYTYTVSGRYIDEPKSETDDILNISADDFYTYISTLNSKIQSGNTEDAYNYLVNNSEYLSIDNSKLSSILRFSSFWFK